MAGIKFWHREVLDNHGPIGPGSPNPPQVTAYDYFVCNSIAEGSEDATVLRVFLDVTVTISHADPPTTSDFAWWPGFSGGVQLGVYAESSSDYPSRLDFADPQVMLTGSLQQEVVIFDESHRFRTVTLRNHFELESKGARKTPVPGTSPAVRGTFWLADDANVFDYSTFGNGYWQVLYNLRTLYQRPA